MGINRTSSFDNWDRDLADIQNKIGEKELENTIKKEIPEFEGWDKFAKVSSNLFKVVTSLIDKSKNYKPRSSLANVLQSAEFEVKTSKGRILFKAKMQP
jgi:hypothetical protein